MLPAKSRRILVVTLALCGYFAGTMGFLIPHSDVQAESAPLPVEPTHSCCCAPEGCVVQCCCTPEPAPPKPTANPAKPAAGSIWVIAISAKQCRGESTSWTFVPLSLPPAAWLTWSYHWVFVHWLAPCENSASIRSNPPPSPPPRSC